MSTIFTLENLIRAYDGCRKNKKNTINALKFEYEREKNLVELLDDLVSGNYSISRHICFIVSEPKPREIFAADFRDRIVHHLLYDEIYKIFDPYFIYNSFANRKQKGTHKAVTRLKSYIRDAGNIKWCLKLDIQNFFCSIDKEILFNLISTKISECGRDNLWKNEIMSLCKKIIFHNPTSDFIYKGDPSLRGLIPENKSLFNSNGSGLPIGNLTSQFFANIYLNELDRFITKHCHTTCYTPSGLGCTRYVRYVDDFVILDEDKDKLVSYIKVINEYLIAKLRLKLHPNKIYLQPVSHGIDFLGYFVKPTHSLVRRSVVKRFKKKLRDNTDGGGFLDICHIPMIQSYLGHFGHADSHNLIRSL